MPVVIAANIAQHGFHLQSVISSPPYTYTIGLHGRGQPELIVIGYMPEAALTLLAFLVEKVANISISDNLQMSAFDDPNFPIVLRIVDPVKACTEYMYPAQFYYRKQIDVMQVFFDDHHGRFPWEHGCNPVAAWVQRGLIDFEAERQH